MMFAQTNIRDRRVLLLLWLALLASTGAAEDKSAVPGELRVSASQFKLRAEGARYAGITEEIASDAASVKWRRENLKQLVVGDTAFYVAHRIPGLDYEGLAAENLSTGKWTVYPMFHLAIAAGWYNPKGEKRDGNYPDAINGLHKVGERLWMGSNGVGVIAYDTKKKSWSRYDISEETIEGQHMTVWYADEEYLFVTPGEFPSARLHVYSMKQDKWLRLDAVPTRNVIAYGQTGPYTQVTIDHEQFAKQEYLPIDWSIALLSKVSLIDGHTYLLRKRFSVDSSTAFKIPRQQLKNAFNN
jgi:hypothetical protein